MKSFVRLLVVLLVLLEGSFAKKPKYVVPLDRPGAKRRARRKAEVVHNKDAMNSEDVDAWRAAQSHQRRILGAVRASSANEQLGEIAFSEKEIPHRLKKKVERMRVKAKAKAKVLSEESALSPNDHATVMNLLYGPSLVQVKEDTVNTKECMYPFVYDYKEWWGCVQGSADSKAWCYLRDHAPEERIKWGWCSQTCPTILRSAECDTQNDGTFSQKCTFPFKYRDKEYMGCTSDDYDKPWCYYEVNGAGRGVVGKWGTCRNEQCAGVPTCKEDCKSDTKGDGVFSRKCVFPFTYGGKTYKSCTTVGSHKPWCYYEVDSAGNGVTGKWGMCSECKCEVPAPTSPSTPTPTPPVEEEMACDTRGNGVFGNTCVFPFTYGSTTYSSCTTYQHDKPWCYYAVDKKGKGKKGKWGECKSTGTTTGGTTGGTTTPSQGFCKSTEQTYGSFKFHGCTSSGFHGPWCYMASGWGTCPRTRACEVEPDVPKHVQLSELTSVPRKMSFASCYGWSFNHQSDMTTFASIVDPKPDVFVWLGDIVYGDTRDTGRCGKLHRDYIGLKSEPAYGILLDSNIPVTGIFDDHDMGSNDQGRWWPYKYEAKDRLLEFLDVPDTDPRWSRNGVYHAHRWEEAGRSLKLVMLDNRYMRDPTWAVYGTCLGETTSLLGSEQWAWLETELMKDKNDVLLIGSSIQVLVPARADTAHLCSYQNGGDAAMEAAINDLGETGVVGPTNEGWAEVPTERTRLLRLVQRVVHEGFAKKVVFISGDVHFAEINSFVIPAKGTMQAVHVFELTTSGIMQRWTIDEDNPHRLGPYADTRNSGVYTKECKFPFVYKGVVYKNCTTVEATRPWCYWQVDSSNAGVSGQWGYCAPEGATIPFGRQGHIGNPELKTVSPYQMNLHESNYGSVEIDWVARELKLQAFAPHQEVDPLSMEAIVHF